MKMLDIFKRDSSLETDYIVEKYINKIFINTNSEEYMITGIHSKKGKHKICICDFYKINYIRLAYLTHASKGMVKSNSIRETPKDVLYEIFIDRKQPATARVAAIREYNNLITNTPEESGEDTLLKLYKMVEKSS